MVRLDDASGGLDVELWCWARRNQAHAEWLVSTEELRYPKEHCGGDKSSCPLAASARSGALAQIADQIDANDQREHGTAPTTLNRVIVCSYHKYSHINI